MAMDKFRTPTEEERRIIQRNGIDLTKISVAVIGRTEDVIFLQVHRTGDEVTIRQGLKKWENY